MLYLNGSIDDDNIDRMFQICQFIINKIERYNNSKDNKLVTIYLNYYEGNKPKNKRIKWLILDDNNEYPIDDIYGDSYVFINRF